jgi:hypothetical protein
MSGSVSRWRGRLGSLVICYSHKQDACVNRTKLNAAASVLATTVKQESLTDRE